MKPRHSMKYDSSSNLLSHFHHRPPSRVARVPSRHRPGEARPQSTLTHTLIFFFIINHTSSGTSGSAIKVACTPISSLISDKCLGFSHHWSIRSATPLHKSTPLTHSLTHSHTGISQTHTRSLLLSDPMNDRSKDCAPRGTLRGSCGSFVPSLSHTLSRTLSALGTNWLWYWATSMCLAAVVAGNVWTSSLWGGGKFSGSRRWQWH